MVSHTLVPAMAESVPSMLAIAYPRSGDLASAGREVRIPLALNSNDRPGYELRGIVLYLGGELDQSATTLRAVLKNTPTRPVAHYFLACALRDRGEVEIVREHFDAADRLRRHPPHPSEMTDLIPPRTSIDGEHPSNQLSSRGVSGEAGT